MLWEMGMNKGSVYWFCKFVVVEMIVKLINEICVK